MYDWLTQHKIPLGAWLKDFVDLLNNHAQGLFDFISLVQPSCMSPKRMTPRRSPTSSAPRASPVSPPFTATPVEATAGTLSAGGRITN